MQIYVNNVNKSFALNVNETFIRTLYVLITSLSGNDRTKYVSNVEMKIDRKAANDSIRLIQIDDDYNLPIITIYQLHMILQAEQFKW